MNVFNVRLANWQDDRSALCLVRETVFIHEQAVPPDLESDEADAECLHLLAVDKIGSPIGTARLLSDGLVGRMAVLKEWRGRGVGSTLVLRLLKEARERQIGQVTLNAQLRATAFYVKFGFKIAGKEFTDAGIPHVRMSLRLSEQGG